MVVSLRRLFRWLHGQKTILYKFLRIANHYFRILKFIISIHILSMMLDDTRGGLDASSLHRAVSMDIYLSKTVGLLSCHRNTLITSYKQDKRKAEKLYSQLSFYHLLFFFISLCFNVTLLHKQIKQIF